MNIKIVIKDSDSNPAIVTKNTLSEVQHKKKNMLYEAPSNQKKIIENKKQKNNKKIQPRQISQSQKKMMKDLNKMSKNQVTFDMVQNSNNILQRQNQILQDNQKSINQMIKNSNNNNNTNSKSQNEAINTLKIATQKVTKQVQEIKKIRDEIVNVGKEVSKALGDINKSPQGVVKIPKQLSDMNKNIKNLTEISHNHLEGLQNLEALKNLQNFNVQVYMQQVNTLKKQIIQYQKQSENIQRELRLRAAKLQKLQMPKSIQNQILQPYTKHLQGRANSINLHQIKDNVYAKLGTFDYSRIESDINQLINQARMQVNEFYLACKQHEIHVPAIKINPKQFKNLEVKFPSVLDQYKASRGIKFKQIKQKNNSEQKSPKSHSPIKTVDKINTNKYINRSPQNIKDRDRLRNIATKPIDLANQVKLTHKDNKIKQTILKDDQKQKTQKKFKENKKNVKSKQQDDFNSYLENRARQQLQALYKEKKEKLQKMERQLYEQCIQPTYINLNIDPRSIRSQENKNSLTDRISINKKIDNKQRQQELQQKKQDPQKKIQPQNSIKQIGKQVLKQKLKQMIKKNSNKHIQQNRIPHVPHQHQPQVNNNQIGNIAQGIVNLINNTLTQVNANLAKNIQRKMDDRRSSQLRRPSKSPISIQPIIPYPKLQPFRAPPIYEHYNNIPSIQPNYPGIYKPTFPDQQFSKPLKSRQQIPSQYIKQQQYNRFKIQNSQEHQDLNISSVTD